MGVFSTSSMLSENVSFTDETWREFGDSLIYDEISRLPEAIKEEFIQSTEAQILVQEGVLKRNTLVRLSKNDDLTRRIGMACIQMCKENEDPLYEKLAKNREKEKELLGKIRTKYSGKAERIAKAGQKEFIKGKIPITFIRK